MKISEKIRVFEYWLSLHRKSGQYNQDKIYNRMIKFASLRGGVSKNTISNWKNSIILSPNLNGRDFLFHFFDHESKLCDKEFHREYLDCSDEDLIKYLDINIDEMEKVVGEIPLSIRKMIKQNKVGLNEERIKEYLGKAINYMCGYFYIYRRHSYKSHLVRELCLIQKNEFNNNTNSCELNCIIFDYDNETLRGSAFITHSHAYMIVNKTGTLGWPYYEYMCVKINTKTGFLTGIRSGVSDSSDRHPASCRIILSKIPDGINENQDLNEHLKEFSLTDIDKNNDVSGTPLFYIYKATDNNTSHIGYRDNIFMVSEQNVYEILFDSRADDDASDKN